MKILSVRQPWAYAIFHGKDIENRNCTLGRIAGPLGIAASAGMTLEEYYDAKVFLETLGIDCPAREDLIYGAILGVVRASDYVRKSDSKWFFGPVGIPLCNQTLLDEPIPAKGRLGLWDFEHPELDRIGRQIEMRMNLEKICGSPGALRGTIHG